MARIDIIKWGGENAGLQKENNEVQRSREGKRVITVSAMRSDEFNTTSELISLCMALQSGQYDLVESQLTKIELFHAELLVSQESGKQLFKESTNLFRCLREAISSYIKDIPTDKKISPTESNDYSINYMKGGRLSSISLVGYGEYISARLNCLYMKQQDEKVTVLESLPGKNTGFFENARLVGMQVNDLLLENEVVFVPGYLSGLGDNNILQKIGRGYTDAVASLVALGVKEYEYHPTLCIEKMVDGFMSIDPRVLKGTSQQAQLIEELNYLLAKEIITEKGPEAKLLHEESLNRHIQSAQIPVRLYNPFSESEGTLVQHCAENMPKGVFYVGGVENIHALIFSSGRMEEGFIADTSSVLASTGVNIKEVLGSSTEHTAVFDSRSSDIDTVLQKLKEEYKLTAPNSGEFIDYRKQLSLIYCVGNMKDVVGTLAQVVNCLKNNNINVKGFNQGLEQRAMAIVVERSDYKKALLVLHKELIEQ